MFIKKCADTSAGTLIYFEFKFRKFHSRIHPTQGFTLLPFNPQISLAQFELLFHILGCVVLEEFVLHITGHEFVACEVHSEGATSAGD